MFVGNFAGHDFKDGEKLDRAPFLEQFSLAVVSRYLPIFLSYFPDGAAVDKLSKLEVVPLAPFTSQAPLQSGFRAVSERFQSGLGARESGRGGRWKKWRSNPIRLESVSHTALLGRSTALSPYQLLIYTVTSSTLDFQSNNEEKHGQFNRNNSQKSQNIPHFSLSLPLQKNKIK